VLECVTSRFRFLSGGHGEAPGCGNLNDGCVVNDENAVTTGVRTIETSNESKEFCEVTVCRLRPVMFWEVFGDESGMNARRVEDWAVRVGSDMEEGNPDGGDVCAGVKSSIGADALGEASFVTGGLRARWKVVIPRCIDKECDGVCDVSDTPVFRVKSSWDVMFDVHDV
jgi:hypothetical protein